MVAVLFPSMWNLLIATLLFGDVLHIHSHTFGGVWFLQQGRYWNGTLDYALTFIVGLGVLGYYCNEFCQ